jgi:uncharacterized protein YjiS (DUF1127 family)
VDIHPAEQAEIRCRNELAGASRRWLAPPVLFNRVDIARLRTVAGWRCTIGEWRRRACQRTQLARMSDGELLDIGLTPADAFAEIHKPCWRR